MPVSSWSTTAADNATADSASGIIWSEGQAPSTINDSARAMMAELKKFYDAPWRPITVLQPSSPVSLLEISIPSDINVLRISGVVAVNTNDVIIAARVSRDGTTYVQGTGNYRNSFLEVIGGGSPAAITNQDETYMRATSTVTTTLPAQIGSLIFFKNPTSFTGHLHTVCGGSRAATGMTIYQGQSYTRDTPFAAPVKLSLFASSGSIVSPTRLVVEGA